MAEDTPAPAPTTSLTGDAAAARTAIDGWRGVPGSPLYTGIDGMTAQEIQRLDRDLIRGEAAGSTGGIVEHDTGPDRDLPLSEFGYDVSGAANAKSMNAHTRGLADDFSKWAYPAGIGQRRFAEAVGFVLSGAAGTPEEFSTLAYASGWPARQVQVALNFYRAATGGQTRDTGGRFAPAPVPAARGPHQAVEAAARRAEIEAEMYLSNGRPGAYWSDPAMRAEYRDLLTEKT